jgi:hypothetical protein
VLFSSGRDTHPDPWGFYMGLVTIGWGASATYESVTGVVSVLSPACFAAFFVGTYSAAIVFLPVNLATGALCGEGHLHEGPQSDAKDHAVAWQFATSAFLVLVGAGVCTWGLSVHCHHWFFSSSCFTTCKYSVAHGAGRGSSGSTPVTCSRATR